MPKRTMGGRADAMAYEASKPRAKLDMEKPVAPTPEQVIPLPRHLPPLPQPVVNGDDNGEEVLTDNVDSDPETQRIYRRRKGREMDNGLHNKRVRPRIGRGATDALSATS
ncbi:hypothetical protein ZWY2020_004322 [Hordeum vulgare]|nr:hypothetical protein ZWY2020_004322 [Hordeum vulgare]